MLGDLFGVLFWYVRLWSLVSQEMDSVLLSMSTKELQYIQDSLQSTNCQVTKLTPNSRLEPRLRLR